MSTYEEGLKDGMLEMVNEDLINVCSRIAVLESILMVLEEQSGNW